MSNLKLLIILLLISVLIFGCADQEDDNEDLKKQQITKLVQKHADAWKTGDADLLNEILHDDVIFAYPGRRLNKVQTLDDLLYFRDNFKDTEVYIHEIIIEGDDVAVEWQFATTKIETGKRQVVSDAIIGKVKDGKIIVWKEYLDGRVKLLQADGTLTFEEGQEPFPWPRKIESNG